MRKLLYLIAVMMSGICIFTACNHKNGSQDIRIDSRNLFLNSRKIAHVYIDSLLIAKDSSVVTQLFVNYDDAITRLNYSYRAGADYDLTEGENDTLTLLSQRIIFLRDSLLESFAKKNIIQTDSLTETP